MQIVSIQKKNNKAFTLIELSIVLVIIALIMGGVLVGRVMIRQSQVSSVMVDMQKYIAAVQSFQQKYASLPGDMANATTYWGIAAGTLGTNYTTDCYATGSATSPATCNGNGDGQINSSSTYSNETLRVWQHLADANFIAGAYTGTTGAAHVIGTNCPTSRIDNGGFGLAWVGIMSSDTYKFDGTYGHAMFFGGYYSNNVPLAATLTASEALSIDTKYDDGKPALGQIRTWKNGAYSLSCASSTAVTAAYSTSVGNLCSLMMITGF